MNKKDEEIKIYTKDEVKKDVLNKKQSKKFLAVYMVGLFSMAFVLILLSYLTQMRAQESINQHTTALEGTQSKMSQLQMQLDQQRQELADKEKEIVALQTQILQQELYKEQSEKDREFLIEKNKETETLELFWQLEKLYRTKKFTEAREILTQIEPSVAYLSPTALEEYTFIKEKLEK